MRIIIALAVFFTFGIVFLFATGIFPITFAQTESQEVHLTIDGDLAIGSLLTWNGIELRFSSPDGNGGCLVSWYYHELMTDEGWCGDISTLDHIEINSVEGQTEQLGIVIFRSLTDGFDDLEWDISITNFGENFPQIIENIVNITETRDIHCLLEGSNRYFNLGCWQEI